MCEDNKKNNKRNGQLSKEELEIYLKIYEVSNQRTIEGTREFYLFSTLILAVLVWILRLSHRPDNQVIVEDLLWLGLILAFIWYLATVVQIKWKKWWGGKGRRIEKEICKHNAKELANILEKGGRNTPKKLKFNFIFGLFPVVIIWFFLYRLMENLCYSFILCLILSFIVYRVSYYYDPFGKNHEQDC